MTSDLYSEAIHLGPTTVCFKVFTNHLRTPLLEINIKGFNEHKAGEF